MKATYTHKLNLQMFAEEEGANVEVVATPPTENTETSENLENTDVNISAENPEVAELETKRDLEKDRAFAELRRKAEDAERKLAAEDQWAKDNWGHLGISTMEQYKQALAEQKKKEEYEAKGIDYDEMKKAIKEEIETHPTVIGAKEKTALLEVNSEIRSLKTAYPDVDIGEIERISDLVGALEKLPNWEQIQQKVAKGYELKDAYELINRDEILKQRTAAAAQAARNSINGKGHLKAGANGGAGDEITIPAEVLEQYRTIFPKRSDADFIADYKRRHAN